MLTTHSMEEAEKLCDRLGIFAEGELRCLGTPSALARRFGGIYLRPFHHYTFLVSGDSQQTEIRCAC